MSEDAGRSDRSRRSVLKKTAKAAAGGGALATVGAGTAAAGKCMETKQYTYVRDKNCNKIDEVDGGVAGYWNGEYIKCWGYGYYHMDWDAYFNGHEAEDGWVYHAHITSC